MGTMASTLAHELNQPLTAIANYLETTRDLLVDPDAETVAIVRDALDEAAKESHRAGHIVRRLRDFVARGETEKRIEDLPRQSAIELVPVAVERLADGGEVVQALDAVGFGLAAPERGQQQRRQNGNDARGHEHLRHGETALARAEAGFRGMSHDRSA